GAFGPPRPAAALDREPVERHLRDRAHRPAAFHRHRRQGERLAARCERRGARALRMAGSPGLRAAHDREPLRPHAGAAGAPLRAAMSPYPLILLGVGLNAAAQLLLKAGTNAVGRFAFDAGSLVPVAARLAFEPHILAGCACYAVSL